MAWNVNVHLYLYSIFLLCHLPFVTISILVSVGAYKFVKINKVLGCFLLHLGLLFLVQNEISFSDVTHVAIYYFTIGT